MFIDFIDDEILKNYAIDSYSGIGTAESYTAETAETTEHNAYLKDNSDNETSEEDYKEGVRQRNKILGKYTLLLEPIKELHPYYEKYTTQEDRYNLTAFIMQQAYYMYRLFHNNLKGLDHLDSPTEMIYKACDLYDALRKQFTVVGLLSARDTIAYYKKDKTVGLYAIRPRPISVSLDTESVVEKYSYLLNKAKENKDYESAKLYIGVVVPYAAVDHLRVAYKEPCFTMTYSDWFITK